MNRHVHKFLVFTGVTLLFVFCFMLLWHFVIAGQLEKWYFRKIPVIQEAEINEKLKNVMAEGLAFRIFLFGAIALALGLPLLVVVGLIRAKNKKASVHTYRFHGDTEVVVHEKDLHIAAPVAMGIVNADQLKAINEGMWNGAERSAELYERLARTNIKIAERRGLSAPTSQAIENTSRQAHIPSFRDLVQTGELSSGKPMILGYENGVPRRGSFLDIYSAAVAGESGSGKTGTLLFLIGSALVSMPVRFVGIDPHYPHPKSLGYKLKPLWEAGLMTMATSKDDTLNVLKYVEQTIENRLKQIDTDETPVVLVIDELAFLSTTSIGGDIAHTMERISMEGRKCAVYMLASSQTWIAAKTGKSSTVRDTLTSAYVHRIKPKQANLLLQDKEEADKVKKHVKQAGEALLVPVGDESTVVRMPFTTEADMHRVAELIGEDAPKALNKKPEASDETELDQELRKLVNTSVLRDRSLPEPTDEPEDAIMPGIDPLAIDPKLLTAEMMKTEIEAHFPSQAEAARQMGITASYLSKILSEGKPLTDELRQKFAEILQPAMC